MDTELRDIKRVKSEKKELERRYMNLLEKLESRIQPTLDSLDKDTKSLRDAIENLNLRIESLESISKLLNYNLNNLTENLKLKYKILEDDLNELSDDMDNNYKELQAKINSLSRKLENERK